MIISINTMFVIPTSGFVMGGIPCNLITESSRISRLTNMGIDSASVCKAFRELFDEIHIDVITKEIPVENRKRWQIFKSKYRTVFEFKNLDVKIRILNYLNDNGTLFDEDVSYLSNIYKRLPPKTRSVIPFDIFTARK